MVALGGFARVGVWLVAGALGGCAGASSDPQVRPLTPPAVPGAPQSSDPALASVPGSRGVILAWLAGGEAGWRLYMANTQDGGDTWSEPVAVTPPGESVHPHPESSPRLIAGSSGRVAAVWATSWEVAGREWPASAIRFSRSSDGGRTWSRPVTLNDDSASAPGGHSFHGVALDGESSLVVAWLDERDMPGGDRSDPEAAEDASLHAVRSEDFGSTWGPNIPISDRVCPCCRVQLCAADGKVTAAWRRHFPGQVRDVVVADLGSAPARAHADNWTFPGCPHTGPALVAASDGRRHLAWYTGAQGRAGVYYARLAQDYPVPEGAVVPLVASDRLPTAHVGLAWSRSIGPVVAFDVDSTGKQAITLAQVDPDRGRERRSLGMPGSDGGRYPQVAPVKGDVVVAWTAEDSTGSRIRMARVRFGRI